MLFTSVFRFNMAQSMLNENVEKLKLEELYALIIIASESMDVDCTAVKNSSRISDIPRWNSLENQIEFCI